MIMKRETRNSGKLILIVLNLGGITLSCSFACDLCFEDFIGEFQIWLFIP